MRTPSKPFLLTPLLLALAASLPTLFADSPPPPPAPTLVPGSRIIKTFDFEEKALGNFESIPMFWDKVAGHGFPAYSTGGFDPTIFRSKENSFKLQIDGGSAAFRYSPGKLPINPSADYYVLAFVKTTQLKHAKAQLSAWFADDAGKLLMDSALHSQPFASPLSPQSSALSPPPDWHVLHLYIPGPGPTSTAKSLVLQLGLLQPQQLAGPAAASILGKFALYQQDIKGAAWFDDIVIFQLPRLSVAVPASVPANIFAPNQKIELDLSVSDVPTTPQVAANIPATTAPSAPTAILKITDPDGILFATQTFSAAASDNHPWTFHYAHPPLPAGLYTATLDVTDSPSTASSPGTLIARRQTRFLCLPPSSVTLTNPPPEFGFTLPDSPSSSDLWPGGEGGQLQHILRQTGAGLVQLPAWRRDMSEDALLKKDPPFDALLAMLQRLNIHAIANFSQVPAALSEKFTQARAKNPPTDLNPPPTDSILALYDSDPALWRPYISFLLARYANRVDWWEFGNLETPYSGAFPTEAAPAALAGGAGGGGGGDPRYPKLYAKTSTELAALLTRPRLVIPWNALFEFDARLYPNARLDLRLPTSIKPSQIPAYIENFQQALTPPTETMPATTLPADSAFRIPHSAFTPASAILAHIDSLDEQTYGRTERLADFAQRIVYAKSANPAAILIDLPITTPRAAGSFTPRPEPTELLLVYRTLIASLGNSTFIREIPLASGIKAFLFERNNIGTLVVWNDSAPEPQIHLDLPLGSAPRQTDLAGNTRPLPINPNTHLASINVSSTPIILDQIDSKALQLRASFGLNSKTLPAGAGAVRTELLLSNPFTETLAGTLKLALPTGWTSDPASLHIAMNPGSSLKQPITIRYPFSELAGPKTIRALFTTDAGQTYDLAATTTITSDTVEFDSSSQLLPSGDLVIQQVITNIGPTPLSAQAFAQVPGYPRQQRYLLDLAPGQTSIKRFTFPLSSYVSATKQTTPADIAAALTNKSATLGLRQTDGRTLLTKSLPLE